MASANMTITVDLDDATATLVAIRSLTCPDQIHQLEDEPFAAALIRISEVHELACAALSKASLTNGERLCDEPDRGQGLLRGPLGRDRGPGDGEADVQREWPQPVVDRVPNLSPGGDGAARHQDQRPPAVHSAQSIEVAIEPAIVKEAPAPQDPWGGLTAEQHWAD